MRAEVFLDTAYAIALSSPNDLFHQRAIAYYKLRDYDCAWDDVYNFKALGYEIVSSFLRELRRVSEEKIGP